MKNKKLKYYLKNNLIGLIVGGIIFGSLGVYAAITFPSNEVSFDPSNSTLSSTNVKDAIDELYKKCTQTTGEQIIEDAGLEKDPYECRYFFTGANPNNYVTFNNETAGWRIVSIECDGTIKIIKNNSIGNMAWDTSEVYGNNNWARPADLNIYLNGTYYNGLNSTAQSQIVAKDWSIGSVGEEESNMANTINNENAKKWNGKVALVTASEYVRSNSNKSSCGTVQQIWNAKMGQCKGTTWMFDSSSWWWTLSPISGTSSYVFFVNRNDGYFNNYFADYAYAVRPVVYLSSEVKITGGNGSQNNPYTLS